MRLNWLRIAIIDGFRAALRLRLLLPWYGCLLLIGLLQTSPLWSAGGRALYNPMLADLAGGGGDLLVDLFLDNPSGRAAAGTWALALLPLTLLSGVVYTYFAGGVLGEYTGKHTFWAGCRRNWWSFLGLGALIFAAAAMVVAVALLSALALGGTAGLVVALLGLALLNVVGEYARAIGVVHDRHNPLVLLGQAAVFCVRHFGGVLVLALLAVLLNALLLGVYLLLSPIAGASPLLIMAQQLLVFGTLWIKALRLALAARYVMTIRE
jgi:hypothetical protein